MKPSLPAFVQRIRTPLQMLLAFVVLATVLLLGWRLLGGSSGASSAEQEAAAAKQVAQSLVAAPASGLKGLKLALKQMAARPEVQSIFSGATIEERKALADLLASGLPGVLKLRLLNTGHSDIETATHPPLTYASLTLLRAAEINPGADQAEAPAELLLGATPDAHILVLQRVLNSEGKLVGFIHASFSPDLIKAWTSTWAGVAGYTELRQSVPKGSPLVLSKSHERAPPGGSPVILPVPESRWSVAYWHQVDADTTGAGAIATPPLLVLTVAAAALTALVAAALVLLKGAWRPAAPTVVFDGAIRSILDGRHPGLERHIPGLPKHVGAALKVVAAIKPFVPDDHDADDITHIASAAGAKPAAKPPAIAAKFPSDDTPTENRLLVAAASDDDEEPVTQVKGLDQHLTESAVMVDFGLFESTLSDFVAVGADAEPEEVERAPRAIFRNYDIRGIAGHELTEDVAYAIGRALGSEAHARGQSSVVVARDGRLSSPELAAAVIQGLVDTGREVIDIGLAPSPVLYFATHYLDARTGVMVTGSHNPAEWNGFKIVLDGEILSGAAIDAIRQRINRGDYVAGTGSQVQADMTAEYIRRLSEDIPVALSNAFTIVVDAGNSVSGLVAPQLLRALGHDVIEINCELDGRFPNHDPDPSQPDNLIELVGRVVADDASFGLAFDGDGDRLGLVTETGEIINADRVLMLLASDILSRNPGAPVLFDTKCSHHLAEVIRAAGGEPIMTRTGHSLIRAEMLARNAPLGGEYSGHFFVAERWYGFDDAFYAAARLIEIMMARKQKASVAFAEFTTGPSTPEIRVPVPAERVSKVMEEVLARASGIPGQATVIDGLRIDRDDAWGLVRASTTNTGLSLRFEGKDAAALKRIQREFYTLLLTIDGDLQLPLPDLHLPH